MEIPRVFPMFFRPREVPTPNRDRFLTGDFYKNARNTKSANKNVKSTVVAMIVRCFFGGISRKTQDVRGD